MMISNLKKSIGLTQKELANKIGRSEKFIKNLEENVPIGDLRLDIIVKLAIAFDMAPKDLFLKLYNDDSFE
jgi:transcriptional regulator with XRE-family HTH domain